MKTIYVNDKMQQNYSYELVAPIGKQFDETFKPAFTPPEMLALGIFEGHYLNDCQDEFPQEWFDYGKLSPKHPDVQQNCFKIKSRLSLVEWRKRGWIIGPDPRGWFQWYCRYYMGRRMPEIDKIQIGRWKAFKRHKIQLYKNCPLSKLNCRPKQRQALLQWSYNPFVDENI